MIRDTGKSTFQIEVQVYAKKDYFMFATEYIEPFAISEGFNIQ